MENLVGTVVKTLIVPAYEAEDFAAAVQICGFGNTDSIGDVVRLFGKEQVRLAESVKIDLVEFDGWWSKRRAVKWGKAYGNRKTIGVVHIMGIAIYHPDAQRRWSIVGLGSVRAGQVLCLGSFFIWRDLRCLMVKRQWDRGHLVGFVRESA